MLNRQLFKSIYNILFLSLLGCLLLGGILLLINWWHWRASASFFTDECCVFLNSKLPVYKFFVKLPYAQVTPLFFSILTKLFPANAGINEYLLRILPLSITIISILLFPILEFKILKNKFAILFALVLLMFNSHIYEFSLFFKHYALDVTMAIIILFIAIYIKDKRFKDKEKNDINNTKIPLVLGIISCCFIWCSYTAAIIIAGAFFAMLLYEKYKFQKINFKSYLIYSIPIIAFSVYLAIFIFIPIRIENIMETCWFTNNFDISEITLQIDKYNNKIWSYISLYYFGEPFYKHPNSLVLLSLLITSFILYYKQDRFIFYFFISVIPVIFVLSILHIYPYGAHRVALYSIPLFCLLLSKAFDITCCKNKILSVIVFVLFCFLIDYKTLYNDFKFFYETIYVESLSNSAYFYKILKHSDVTSDDYIFMPYIFEMHGYNYGDKNSNILTKNTVSGSDEFDLIDKNRNVFFYLSKDYYPHLYDETESLINNNCKIIYAIDDNTGVYSGKFIKCRKITPAKN